MNARTELTPGTFPVDSMEGDPRPRLIGLVTRFIAPEAAPPEPFPIHQQLSELGMSSLKMVNLMLAIEVEFDIEIPTSLITPETFHSVASMATVIELLKMA